MCPCPKLTSAHLDPCHEGTILLCQADDRAVPSRRIHPGLHAQIRCGGDDRCRRAIGALHGTSGTVCNQHALRLFGRGVFWFVRRTGGMCKQSIFNSSDFLEEQRNSQCSACCWRFSETNARVFIGERHLDSLLSTSSHHKKACYLVLRSAA